MEKTPIPNSNSGGSFRPKIASGPVAVKPVQAAAPQSAPPVTATPPPKPAPKALPQAPGPETRQVTLEFYHATAKAVHVAGTFNKWDPHVTPMQKTRPGKWELALSLLPGKYEYRFVVDGQWMEDPLVKTTVPNPFGGVNSVLVVK